MSAAATATAHAGAMTPNAAGEGWRRDEAGGRGLNGRKSMLLPQHYALAPTNTRSASVAGAGAGTVDPVTTVPHMHGTVGDVKYVAQMSLRKLIAPLALLTDTRYGKTPAAVVKKVIWP
jgi:hypothetical protein